MMNSDPLKSAQPCGCDEGANHECEECRSKRLIMSDIHGRPMQKVVGGWQPVEEAKKPPLVRSLFPNSAQGRKDHPVFTGFMMYFPDVIAAIAHVSKLGNDQHNPGQPLHWAREKSTDQMDTAARHQMDHGVGNIKDTDGAYHLAKAIWRLCAELQLTIEREREGR